LDRRAANESVARLAAESGLPIDPGARVETLSVAARQRVEILKALYRRARVLILDEPTAVLAPNEARELWAATARLSQSGTTIVFITHKLDEVMAHADEVTVLRRGHRILSSPSSGTDPERMARAMVGGEDVAGETSSCIRPNPSVPFPPSFAALTGNGEPGTERPDGNRTSQEKLQVTGSPFPATKERIREGGKATLAWLRGVRPRAPRLTPVPARRKLTGERQPNTRKRVCWGDREPVFQKLAVRLRGLGADPGT
jgi:energy-coupling factor transporter ATP-binding protein EcfA2